MNLVVSMLKRCVLWGALVAAVVLPGIAHAVGADGVIVRFKPTDSLSRRIQSAVVVGGGHRDASVLAAETQAMQLRASALGQRRGLGLRHLGGIDPQTQVVTADGIDAATLARRLAADADVEWAEPNHRRRALRVPNDPLYVPTGPLSNTPASGQWYLKAPAGQVLSSINAEGAWDITTGSASMVVAVLDTGVRLDHADLAGKLLPGYDMVSDPAISNDGDGRDPDPSDPGDYVTTAELATPMFSDCSTTSSWHGTETAGLIGAATDNNLGMAAVGWQVKVLPMRVLGKCFGRDSDIIAGMRWAAGLSVPGIPDNPAANRARVINLSLGGEGACTNAYRNAVQEVNALGAVVVAAAGNSAGHAVGMPANCPGVIGVAALRHIGTKVGFSDLGPEISLAAPGGNCVNLSGPCLYPILTTTNSGTQAPVSHGGGGSVYTGRTGRITVGTSFAAPLVAGTAALMLSANPGLTPAQVRDILRQTARAFPFRSAPNDPETSGVEQCRAPDSSEQLQCYCTESTCGAGMLDARWAVHHAANNAATVSIASSIALAPNQPVTLTVSADRPLAAVQWTLIDGGGITSGFASGSTTVTTATGNSVVLTPNGFGKFSLRVLVTDGNGVQSVREQTFTVGETSGDGGGGGASSWPWLAGLALAVAALRRRRA